MRCVLLLIDANEGRVANNPADSCERDRSLRKVVSKHEPLRQDQNVRDSALRQVLQSNIGASGEETNVRESAKADERTD